MSMNLPGAMGIAACLPRPDSTNKQSLFSSRPLKIIIGRFCPFIAGIWRIKRALHNFMQTVAENDSF
jgi:hypothetical protein